MRFIPLSRLRSHTDVPVEAPARNTFSHPVMSYLMYALAWGALAGGELALVPLLSRMLPRAEFGKYLLVYGLLVFLSDAVAIWASTSFVRMSPGVPAGPGRSQMRSTLLGAQLLGSVLVSLGLGVGAVIAALSDSADYALLAVTGAIFLPMLSSFSFLLADFQASARPELFCAAAVARTIVVLAAGLLAIAVLDPTAVAFLAGSALGLTVLILPYLVHGLSPYPFRAGTRPIVHEALRFGAGMWFQNLGGKVLRIGDRYIVGAYLGAASVAVYGAGYTLLVGAISIVVSPLITALTPLVFDASERNGDEATRTLLETVLQLYLPGASLVVSLAFIAAPVGLPILLPPDYVDAFSPAMMLALLVAGAIHGAALVINLVFAVRRRTHISAALFLVLALTNLVGNLVFVPRYGIAGAAWVTLLSYVALLVATVAYSRRHLPVRVPGRLGILCLGGIVIVALLPQLAGDLPAWSVISGQILVLLAWNVMLVGVIPDLRRRLTHLFALRTRSDPSKLART